MLYFTPAVSGEEPTQLDGSHWWVSDIHFTNLNQTVTSLKVAGLTLQFDAGRVNGSTGCSIFTAPYVQQGDQVTIIQDELEVAPPNCPDEVSRQLHTLFVDELMKIDTGKLQPGQGDLWLKGPDSSMILYPGKLPPPLGWENAVAWELIRSRITDNLYPPLDLYTDLAYNQPGLSLAETLAALEKAWGAPLDSSLRAHFISRNETPRNIRDTQLTNIPHSNGFRYVSGPDIQRRALVFSRVDFSRDGRQALIYVADEQETMRTGRYYLLVWDGTWRVEKETTLWQAPRAGWSTPTPTVPPKAYPPPATYIPAGAYPPPPVMGPTPDPYP